MALKEKLRERASRVTKAKTRADQTIPSRVGLAVVGAGPHAAALVMRLLTRGNVLSDANGPLEGYRNSPKEVRDHLYKTPVDEFLKDSIVVIDHAGGWMLNWQRQCRAFGIKHLRSPESLHPDPYDHSALSVFAQKCKIEDQFVTFEIAKSAQETKNHLYVRGRAKGPNRRNRNGDRQRFRGPYRLPSVDMFAKFSSHLIEQAYGLNSLLREGAVTALTKLPGSSRSGFELTVLRPDGESTQIIASNVVLARGPTARRQIPEWAQTLMSMAASQKPVVCPVCGDTIQAPPSMSIAHAWDIIESNATVGLSPTHQSSYSPFVQAVVPGDRVVVVGGGLTSAHLVVLLAEHGICDIKLILRGPRKVKNFDLTLPWFGNDRWVKRQEFEKATVPEKLRAIVGERQGGSITPELHAKVQALEAEGICEVIEYAQVRSAVWIEQNEGYKFEAERSRVGAWEIMLDNDTDLMADKIWLATGSQQCVETDPLLKELIKTRPIPIHSGLPELLPTLRWAPDVPLYLMGGLAALQLGPDAANLAGALRGALRVSTELKQQLNESKEVIEICDEP